MHYVSHDPLIQPSGAHFGGIGTEFTANAEFPQQEEVRPQPKAKKAKRKVKDTNTLRISNVPRLHVQEMQQVLAECGPIKMLDTHKLSER